ncbi:MAG: TPM domain-containing protein [Oscillospiraceae bacterium]|nr:TPM domain-containing protein [Oscillospiraceae bacterium]
MNKTIKRFIVICLLSTLILSITFVAFADEESTADRAAGYHVYDDADLLSTSQWNTLEDMASRISTEYECGIYIVTVNDFTEYTDTGDVLDAAENIYNGMDFGYGDGRDGQLLLLSMADRDYALVAYGDFGNAAFTDYGKDLVIDEFLDDFSINDWYSGFYDYLDECEYLLHEARNGEPVDIMIPDDDPYYYPDVEYKPTFMDYVRRYLFSLVPGSLVSLITCSVLRSKNKTVRTATEANRYVTGRGLDLYRANEIFLHRSQTRHVIEHHDRSSFGGGSHPGGTTIRPSGFSGKSGKF